MRQLDDRRELREAGGRGGRVSEIPVTSSNLEHALDVIIKDCLDVREGESVLVVADRGSDELAGRMVRAAAQHGAEAALALIELPGRRGDEPPGPIAAALAATDVFLAPTLKGSLSHTEARRAATAAGVRGATLPFATAEMVARLMLDDRTALKARSEAVAKLLETAGTAHLICPNGSEMEFDLTGRHGFADSGDLTARRAFGNLPAGEGYVSPRHGHGVVAATSGPLGLMAEPMLLTIEDGRLVAASGAHGSHVMELLLAQGQLATNLAELGIGTNEAARVTGNVLEDEKALGTVHVAFGASAGIGGTVSVPIHRDFIVVEPTLVVGGVPVIDAGRWAL